MKITFENDQGQYLGSMTHDQFDQILVPNYTAEHPVYVKKSFLNNSHTDTWKVVSKTVDNRNNEIKIQLKAEAKLLNLPSFISQQNKKPYHYLEEFGLVEVEFGFHRVVVGSNLNLESKNEIYTDNLIKGEMHKKRPCIILKNNSNTTQVIPITTSRRSDSVTDIELELDQIDGIPDKFKNSAHALLGMIQTVSHSRVYPIIDPRKKLHTRTHLFKLTANDREKIRAALATIYSKSLKLQYEQKVKDFDKLSNERAVLLNKQSLILSEKKHLESLVARVGNYLNIGTSSGEVERYFNDHALD